MEGTEYVEYVDIIFKLVFAVLWSAKKSHEEKLVQNQDKTCRCRFHDGLGSMCNDMTTCFAVLRKI